MKHWYMLTVVGGDRPGIVSHLTHALYEGGCNLGETSMMRLGGNFTIMMMVQSEGSRKALDALIEPVIDSLGLHAHIDPIEGGLHQHQIPDVRIRVFGADRAGIVAQVTAILASAGFNILELESDVAGSEKDPVYIMNIQGFTDATVESLQQALQGLDEQGVEVQVSAIETLIG